MDGPGISSNPISPRAGLGWHAFGLLSVAAFAAVMAVMFWPRGQAPLLSLNERRAAAMFVNDEEWQGLYFGDQRIGFGMTRTQVEEGRLHVEQRLHLRLRLAGREQRLDSRLALVLLPDASLHDLSVEAEVAGMGLSVRGRLEGGRLVANVAVGSQELRVAYPVPARLFLEPLLLRRLAREDLSAGRRFRAQVFDARSLAPQEIEIEVVALEALPASSGLRPAVHLRRRQSGVVLDTWIDGDGRVLREESSLGLRSQREERSRAEAEPDLAPDLDGEALKGLFPSLWGTP
jgi:hypothetical protein